MTSLREYAKHTAEQRIPADIYGEAGRGVSNAQQVAYAEGIEHLAERLQSPEVIEKLSERMHVADARWAIAAALSAVTQKKEN